MLDDRIQIEGLLPQSSIHVYLFFQHVVHICSTWLMQHRGFANFTITHFLRYKFAPYWNSYLEPLLQRRHEQKKRGDQLAATLNKLIMCAHYGRQGVETTNYDTLQRSLILLYLFLHINPDI